MDFDEAKENIQPLAAGRNASILQASLRLESPQELLEQRRQLEEQISSYVGDDPLEAWYSYISWIEQSFPSGGKESGLEDVLTKCLGRFEGEIRYYQDRRMIKLFIKFIDSHQDPTECYQQLFDAGIGTMVADLYICWAYYYDLSGHVRRADEIFRRGIACRAQPIEELKEAHQHFGFSVAQRLIYQDNEDYRQDVNKQLQERRQALTSLRGHRRKAVVGSVRTGAAIKSTLPGIVRTETAATSKSKHTNERVQVFNDENNITNLPTIFTEAEEKEESEAAASAPQGSKAVIRSIIDAARQQENQKEPGPWNKAHAKKKPGKLFGKSAITSDLRFSIHEDKVAVESNACNFIGKPMSSPIKQTATNFDKPFKYPSNFQCKNQPQLEWNTPVTIENEPDVRSFPQYNKCMLYPRPNMEFQMEELRAYHWFKRRGIENTFTNLRNAVWSSRKHDANIRQYPNFATRSRPQQCEELDKYFAPPKNTSLVLAFDKIYDSIEKEEFQFEELMARRFKQNMTIITTTDMEETVCLPSDRVQRRKSFFPVRKTIAPKALESVHVLSPPLDNFLKSTPEVMAEVEAENNLKLSQENTSKNMKPNLDCDGLSAILQTKEIFSEEKHQNVLPSSTINSEQIQSELGHEVEVSSLQDPQQNADLKITTFPSQVEVLSGEEFQFKTPAAPATVKSDAKLPFTIYTEPLPSYSSVTTPTESDANLDADETCSTQTFNIFLKSQFMSTPKAALKIAPRQFGTLLKDATASATSNQFSQMGQHEEQSAVSPISSIYTETENRESVAIPYSPHHHKQLSTILETSEHGSTQGTTTTHTTGGASTKSTIISSPEYESVSETKLTGGGRVIVAFPPNSEVKTLQQQSGEFSTSIEKSTANYEAELKTGNIDEVQTIPVTTDAVVHNSTRNIQIQVPTANTIPTTPEAFRTCGGDLNFSIFVDNTELEVVQPKRVGNFTHLEQREDTEVDFPMRTVRFQEEKTETISKMLLSSSQVVKFQDDKTETISKMLIPPAAAVATTHFVVQDTPEERSKEIWPAHDAINLEDTFELFVKTPPKLEKPKLKLFDKSSLLNSFECSPLTTAAPKRFCDIDTPQGMPKMGFTMMTKQSNATATIDANKETSIKNLFDDSVLQFGKNASIAPFPSETKSVLQRTSSVPPKGSMKVLFKDSHISDFSFFDEIQPKHVIPSIQENPNTDVANSSLSFIKDSQPYSIAASNRKEPILLQDVASQSQLGNSLLNDFSKVMDSQPLQLETKLKKSAITLTANTETKERNNHMLMESYMNDFSAINEPLKDHAEVVPESKTKETSKFVNNSTSKQTSTGAIPKTKMPLAAECNASFLSGSSLKFLNSLSTKDENDCRDPITSQNIFETTTTRPHIQTEYQCQLPSADQSLELNAATQMFMANSSLIKNSTWLPNRDPSLHQSQMRENSLHIKTEAISSATAGQQTDLETSYSIFKSAPASTSMSFKRKPVILAGEELSILSGNTAVKDASYAIGRLSIDANAPELCTSKATKQDKSPLCLSNYKYNDDDDDNDKDKDNEFSIYYKETPKTPKIQKHTWDDSLKCKTPDNNHYVHQEVDLNHSQQIIENICIDSNVNPFNADLINAFLEQIDFTNYINDLDNCMLLGHVSKLNSTSTIRVHQTEFKILKLIGEGAYGAVYCGVAQKSGKKYALKQERPPNYWEYYICLEVHSRLRAEEMHTAFMSIDYALIGHNSSILISSFSQYGSLIAICNKIKKYTMKNLDEYVVMHLTCELLDIIDHLHAIGIIHADIKADNVLLMNKLKYPCTERSLQLIDYGVSIDMKRFKEGQTFSYANKDNAFKCVEMREQRPWTFQLDLYGLAGVIHVLLFGKYIDIEKGINGIWMHKTHVPRYLNKSLWDTIFKTILNVRDCVSLPNLQQLRAMLKEEIAEKEKYVVNKISDFNRVLEI